MGGVRVGADHMWVQLRDPQSVYDDVIITDTLAGADLWSVPLPGVELLFLYHEKLERSRHGRRAMINIFRVSVTSGAAPHLDDR